MCVTLECEIPERIHVHEIIRESSDVYPARSRRVSAETMPAQIARVYGPTVCRIVLCGFLIAATMFRQAVDDDDGSYRAGRQP